MNFPYEIRSITEVHPILNNPNLDMPLFQGIRVSNANGDPIEPLAAPQAEGTIALLLAAQSAHPDIITNPVIETAKNRAHVLRETVASLEFGIQPGGVFFNAFREQLDNHFAQLDVRLDDRFAQLDDRLAQLDDRFARLDHRLARQEAVVLNTRIIMRNRRFFGGVPPLHALCPLLKCIDGDGNDLALPICTNQESVVIAQGYHPHAAIGNIPSDWDDNIDGYLHVRIIELVVFYNDNFHINAGDTIDARRAKLRAWLIEE